MENTPALDWTQIDTVLLDMDGTLLDLHFDNWFWREVIPARYGAVHGLSAADSWEHIAPLLRATRGTLEWYCIDHWGRQLGLDIAQIKRATLQHIGYLPGAEDFLRKLKDGGKRRVLVTNAHPTTLAIKDQHVGLSVHFDACYSTHVFGMPKEIPGFWPRLQAREPFEPQRTLFVDDSLAVLEAAHGFGIGWLRAIRRPDSCQPPQYTGPFVAVDRVSDLLP